ncbi:hypothetical protein Fcan01_22178 [Folsomia candida]|uniref:Uncharacterized protein n=1 Tax=Folsomia candida TaxID=158441 RepID=A0A226DFM0_FOLCA|nr:hypothetical protein Fcan01_22178 [Folsomia candida]
MVANKSPPTFHYFSQECRVLSQYQKYFLDGYPFGYKLAIEWSPRHGKTVLVRRKYFYFWDRVPFVLGAIAVLAGIFGLWALKFNISRGIAPNEGIVACIQKFGCYIVTTFGFCLCGGAYFGCIRYVGDLRSGENWLIAMFKRMEYVQSLGKVGKRSMDPLCLFARTCFPILYYLTPVGVLTLVWFGIDPANHIVLLVKSVINQHRLGDALLVRSTLFFVRYIVTLLACMEVIRFLYLICFVVNFGVRLMNATLQLVIERLWLNKDHSLSGYRQIRIIMGTAHSLQSQGGFFLVSLVTGFSIILNIGLISLIRNGAPWYMILLLVYGALTIGAAFLLGLSLMAVFSDKSLTYVKELKRVAGRVWRRFNRKLFLREIRSVRQTGLPLAVNDFVLCYMSRWIKMTIPTIIVEETINLMLSY